MIVISGIKSMVGGYDHNSEIIPFDVPVLRKEPGA
jgi:hypothetical protein